MSEVESNMIVCQDFFQEFSNGVREGEKRAQRSSRGSNWGRGQWAWLIMPIQEGEKLTKGPSTPLPP